MPKVEIDYSNTIIYKIVCKDPNVKDIYVGHTTNFVQRKYTHKATCNNPESPYNNCKLYQVIRNNGGWKNWSMEIVDFFKCNDLYEARKKEQEYFILFNANLNSIEPMSKTNINSTKENEKITVVNELENKCNKVANKYFCEKCHYKSSKKFNLDRHYSSSKHTKKIMEMNKKMKMSKSEQHEISCDCGKSYKNKSGLWKHQKKCNYNENKFIAKNNAEYKESEENVINNNMIVELLKQNNEFKELIIEQNKKILELVNTNNSITNNTNNITNNNNTTNNNKFNLNVFLNEKCKDALNLTDFISNLNVGFADFENFGKIGYSNSISHIFIRGLKELDIYKRPIHCSDLKREVIHIKDDNTWKKDDEKEQMIKAIKMIEHKNIKQIPDWIKAHPAHADIRSKKFDEYSKMLDQSMGEYEDEDNQKNYQKIIRTVAKEILVDKDKS